MELVERYARLELKGQGEVVLVLDASESAGAVQQEIVGLAQEVISGLPVSAPVQLYFLGNPMPYPAAELASRAAAWCKENRTRASLVAPVWEALGAGTTSAIVIIGSGPVFDLEDWAESSPGSDPEGQPLLQRTLLVSMGESMQGSSLQAEELVRPGITELLSRLHDPVVRVEISAPGFMPLWWDNPGYRFEVDRGRATLVAEQLESYGVPMRCYLARGETLQARLTRASGRGESRALDGVESCRFNRQVEGQLGPQEVQLMGRIVQHETFTCLHCGQEHSWDTVRCTEGPSLLGENTFPSLRGVSGFVLIRLIQGQWRFTTYPSPVLRLGLGIGDVAIREGQQAFIYHFDAPAGAWQRTGEPMQPYCRVGEVVYAVLF